ncbi:MAG: hypothetical protein Q7R86_02005 [bacterium]|nr:hypothetical protein [bacterium]
MDVINNNLAPGDWDNPEEDGYLDDDLNEGGLFPEGGDEELEIEDEI